MEDQYRLPSFHILCVLLRCLGAFGSLQVLFWQIHQISQSFVHFVNLNGIHQGIGPQKSPARHCRGFSHYYSLSRFYFNLLRRRNAGTAPQSSSSFVVWIGVASVFFSCTGAIGVPLTCD